MKQEPLLASVVKKQNLYLLKNLSMYFYARKELMYEFMKKTLLNKECLYKLEVNRSWWFSLHITVLKCRPTNKMLLTLKFLIVDEMG